MLTDCPLKVSGILIFFFKLELIHVTLQQAAVNMAENDGFSTLMAHLAKF